MVTQNSSFTNGNLEVQEGRSRSVCLQNFLPFCQYIFHLLDGGFHYINTKYKGAVINKAFNSGKARLDLTQGMWQQLHWGVWIQSSQYNLPRNSLCHWALYNCYCMEWTGSHSPLCHVLPLGHQLWCLLFNFQLWRFLLPQQFNCHPEMIVITVQGLLVVYAKTLKQ